MVTQRSIFLTTRQNNWNEKYPTPQGRSRPTVGLLPVCAWGWAFLLRSSKALYKSCRSESRVVTLGGTLLLYAPESGALGEPFANLSIRRPANRFFSPRSSGKTGRETDRGGALCATSIFIGVCCFDGWLLTARIVGSFAGDGDVVRVTLLHTGVRDAREFGVVQRLNGGSTAVAHARA